MVNILLLAKSASFSSTLRSYEDFEFCNLLEFNIPSTYKLMISLRKISNVSL